MSSRLSAMRERGIRADFIDNIDMKIVFRNGVTLPIQCWLLANKETESDEPVDGGFAHFGSDSYGYGYYPVKLITEEEWLAERQRQ